MALLKLLGKTGKKLATKSLTAVVETVKETKQAIDEALEDTKMEELEESLKKHEAQIAYMSEAQKVKLYKNAENMKLAKLAKKMSDDIVEYNNLAIKRGETTKIRTSFGSGDFINYKD